MNRLRFVLSFAILAAVAAVATSLALAQQPAPGPNTTIATVENGVLVERTLDGKELRRQSAGPLTASTPTIYRYQQDGRTVTYVPPPPDAESQKLISQEQAAAQEARALATQAQQGASEADKIDAKNKLREKLMQIFDLQQQRRNQEITKIEDRLAKLKETLKKRDAAKESIVDRRLETLTGGVDELGWEDSFGNVPAYVAPGYGAPNWSRGPATALPSPVPVPAAEPRAVPPATAPRAGGGYPAAPAPPVIPSRAPPATAPAPPAAPAPPVAPAPPADPVPAAVAPAAAR